MDDKPKNQMQGAAAVSESELCDWLEKNGMLLPCPFQQRLDGAAVTAQLASLLRSLGYRYGRCTLESFEVYDDRQKPVLERLRRFSQKMPEHLRGGGGLLLYGDPGTGKDHLLASLLKIAVAQHKLSAMWTDAGQLFDDIAAAATSESNADLPRLQSRLLAPHILAISDPQPPKGDLAATQVRRVRDVIDRRYRAGKSTWITTNIDRREDAVGLLTEPVMQRLREDSGAVLCEWPNYRDQQKAKW